MNFTSRKKKNFSSLNVLPIINSTAAKGINMFFLESRCLIHLCGRKTLLRPTGFVYYSLFSLLLMQQKRFHLGQICTRKMCFFCSQFRLNCCCGKVSNEALYFKIHYMHEVESPICSFIIKSFQYSKG